VQPRLEELERRIVLDGNSPPVAMDSSFMLGHNSWLSAQVQAFDPDFDPLTFSPLTLPSHGQLFFDPSGAFTYMPWSGFAGTDGFQFQVSDGLASSVGAITFTVMPGSNNPPVTHDLYLSAQQGQTLYGMLPGSDPDFDPLTFGAGSYPAHGSLYVDPYGSFSYTPLPSFSGSDSFTFWVSDGTHQSYATALINVTGAGLSVGDISGNEGDGGTTPFMFWVSRAGDLSGTASVQYATRSRSTASRCRKASPSRCRRCSPSPSPSRRACR
jgi:hypothetical protein